MRKILLPLSAAILLLSAAILLLGACGQAEDEAGPGGVSVGEAKALDEAAEMIESRRLPEQALPDASNASQSDAAPLPPPDEQPQESSPE